MIDEEDDEEILKKKRSLKSVLKSLVLIGLVLIGVMFIYIGEPDPTVSLMIGFFCICLATSILQMKKEPSDPVRQTLTILKCKSCGAIKVRNYESGDFIFKSTDTCDECDEPMQVNQIYSVKLKKAKDKSNKLEKDKEELKQTIEI
ncbi:MAG: hypothetical protein HWN79_11960 [Candidatus Lokiarchaeota archaeon]|nr:hypothetical protein [Candidatus Lokiarchaeota archaeon]